MRKCYPSYVLFKSSPKKLAISSFQKMGDSVSHSSGDRKAVKDPGCVTTRSWTCRPRAALGRSFMLSEAAFNKYTCTIQSDDKD